MYLVDQSFHLPWEDRKPRNRNYFKIKIELFKNSLQKPHSAHIMISLQTLVRQNGQIYSMRMQRNWVLATISNFLIPFSLQLNVVDLGYYILLILLDKLTLSLTYQKFTPSGFKDKGIRIFECVAKTQFLYPVSY